MNKYFDLVGKKIKLKDSGFVGTVVDVKKDKIVLVNDNGLEFVCDMPQLPYYKKQIITEEKDRFGKPIKKLRNPKLNNEKYQYAYVDPAIDREGYSGRYRALWKGISIGSYATREEADDAIIDFVDNMNPELSLEENIENYKKGEKYTSAKQSAEQYRQQKTQEGVTKATESYASENVSASNTSGFNGVGYAPLGRALGLQISKGMTRNRKPRMSDQIVIYHFGSMIDENGNRKRMGVQNIWNMIKQPIDAQPSSYKNVFEYADKIAEQVNLLYSEGKIDFDSSRLYYCLYSYPEKKALDENGYPLFDRFYASNLYWIGNEKPSYIDTLLQNAE